MGAGSVVLFIVIFLTLYINYVNNRCPNCKKWEFKGFNRIDEEEITDEVKVFCTKCEHTWSIKYKKSDFQPKQEIIKKD